MSSSFPLAIRAAVTTPEAITLVESLEAELTALRDHYKAMAVDGLSVAEIWELAQSAVASAMKIAKDFKGDIGDQTLQEYAMAFAGQFYDEVIAPIDLPKIPNIIETRFVDPALRSVFLLLIQGSIKTIINLLGRTGWVDVPGQNGADADPVVPDASNPVPETPSGFIPY